MLVSLEVVDGAVQWKKTCVCEFIQFEVSVSIHVNLGKMLWHRGRGGQLGVEGHLPLILANRSPVLQLLGDIAANKILEGHMSHCS